MNWLITGGCGFIGTNLIHHLLQRQQSHAIRVIDNQTVGTEHDLSQVAPHYRNTSNQPGTPLDPGDVQLVSGDITDEHLAQQVASGTDAIIHLAANTGVQPSIDDPRKDCTTNVVGTLNYLEAARRRNVKRFVFASSGGTVIGDTPPPIFEEMVPHPKSPYGASKSACEGYLSAYHGSYGLQTIALRFSNVYGPRSNHKNSVIARHITRALEGQPLQIHGDGNQTRDFIYVNDLVDAIHKAATTPGIGGSTIQIATNQPTTINQLTQQLANALARAGHPTPPPQNTPPLTGEIRHNHADITRAKELLHWQPTTSLGEGLDKTIHWFRRELRGTPGAVNRGKQPAAAAESGTS